MVGLMKISSKMAYATPRSGTQSPCPCSRPLLTHTSTGDTKTLKGKSDTVSVGSAGVLCFVPKLTTYTRLGQQNLGGKKKKKKKILYLPETRRKDQWPHKRLSKTHLWVSRSLQHRCGLAEAYFSVRGTECFSTCMRPFEGSPIIFITSTKVWSQVKQHGGNTDPLIKWKSWLKIFWAWHTHQNKT